MAVEEGQDIFTVSTQYRFNSYPNVKIFEKEGHQMMSNVRFGFWKQILTQVFLIFTLLVALKSGVIHLYLVADNFWSLPNWAGLKPTNWR